MRRSGILALASALVFVAPAAAGDGFAPYAPSTVLAETTGPWVTSLQWAPGPEEADSYRIYGLKGSTKTLLADTALLPAPRTLVAVVPAGFETYAVSGVQDGLESKPVPVSTHLSVGCYHVQTSPPGVSKKACDEIEHRHVAFHYPVYPAL